MDAYARLYAKRARAGRGFESADNNALAALFLVRAARARPALRRRSTMDVVDAFTRGPLTEGVKHSVATDVAGLAWIEAYGVLPVDAPPAEQTVSVHESGRRRGIVSGMVMSLWRALFLAAGHDLFNWRRRPLAVEELDRLRRNLGVKADGLLEQCSDRERLSQLARHAFVLTELGARAADAALNDVAAQLVDRLSAHVDPAGDITRATSSPTSTSHVLQLALAASVAHRTDIATLLAGRLVTTRSHVSGVLRTSADAGSAGDISPWSALGALGALTSGFRGDAAAAVAPATPTGLVAH